MNKAYTYLIGLGLALLVVSITMFTMNHPGPSVLSMTYCKDEASPTTPRCPPEAGTVVQGVWLDGSSATLVWTGKEWQLRIPGGRYQSVTPPYDWREIE